MSDTMSAMSPQQYRPTSRSWVKLWVGEWLDGTTRYEMTGAQRAFWADLLALAGRSRFPGIVCSGVSNEKIMGYPLARFEGILNDETVNVLETLQMFERSGKVRLECTRKEAPALYAVHILSWEKYQSEYQQKRQRTRYKKDAESAQNVRPNVRETSAVEVEGEVEVEVEGDAEAEATAAAFSTMNCEPYGPKQFQTIWREEQTRNGSHTFVDAMERTIRRCEAKKIKVPGRFFAHKREIEKLEAGNNYKKNML